MGGVLERSRRKQGTGRGRGGYKEVMGQRRGRKGELGRRMKDMRR